MRRLKRWLPMVLLAGVAPIAPAGTAYDAATGSVRAIGYPKNAPCSPAILLAADRANGWGKVSYDPQNAAYVVNCDLWIGDAADTDTYFQIGGPERRDETLIVNGNVRVSPSWRRAGRPEKNWWSANDKDRRVNRLTLGVEGRPDIRAALKIDNRKKNGHTLTVGEADNVETHGGELQVFNSAITAFGEARAGETLTGAPKSVGLYGRKSVVLKNVEIAGTASGAFMSRGVDSRFGGKLENVTFRNGGVALADRIDYVNGCSFIDCEVAVRATGDFYGVDDITLERCVFRGNRRNWELFGGKGVTLIDCDVDTAARDAYRPWKREGRETLYPRALFKRRAVVSVIDDQGRPVNGAEIKIVPEQVMPETQPVFARTGRDGATPSIDAPDAILLVEKRIQSTDTPDIPETLEYEYTIRAEVEWLKPAVIRGFKPGFRKTATLVLKKTE